MARFFILFLLAWLQVYGSGDAMQSQIHEFSERELLYSCLEGEKKTCKILIDNSLPSVTECSEKAGCIIIARIFSIMEQYEMALPYLQKSCNFGILESCFEYALNFENLGMYEKAHTVYKRSCHNGFMDSCYNLAMLYVHGLGVQEDMQKANRIFFEACANDEVQSCYNLAVSYKQGIGVKADRLQAKEFFKKACKLGMELGCKEFKIIDSADFSITIHDHLKAKK